MTVLAARYELLDKVGEGGMSVVWRARDRKLDREVAIKMLRSLVAPDPAQLRRFHREARALAALAHGHIVRIYDYISNDEQSFLVMEYVDGANLAQTTRGRLPLATGEAAAYMRPVAQALAYAHGRGVVHRDLTPSNILVERGSGRVVTTDFGLARIARSTGSLTATGVLLGTPEYWSPELALGRENGAAADLYALGCILFLLLSGRLPFEGEDRLAVGLRRAHDDAPSLQSLLPDARAPVAALVDSLLARDPERRPDATHVAEELGALADASTAFLGVAVGASALDEQTVALLSEQPTTHLWRPSATTDLALPPEAQPASTRRRSWARRRVVIGLAASARSSSPHSLSRARCGIRSCVCQTSCRCEKTRHAPRLRAQCRPQPCRYRGSTARASAPASSSVSNRGRGHRFRSGRRCALSSAKAPRTRRYRRSPAARPRRRKHHSSARDSRAGTRTHPPGRYAKDRWSGCSHA